MAGLPLVWRVCRAEHRTVRQSLRMGLSIRLRLPSTSVHSYIDHRLVVTVLRFVRHWLVHRHVHDGLHVPVLRQSIGIISHDFDIVGIPLRKVWIPWLQPKAVLGFDSPALTVVGLHIPANLLLVERNHLLDSAIVLRHTAEVVQQNAHARLESIYFIHRSSSRRNFIHVWFELLEGLTFFGSRWRVCTSRRNRTIASSVLEIRSFQGALLLIDVHFHEVSIFRGCVSHNSAQRIVVLGLSDHIDDLHTRPLGIHGVQTLRELMIALQVSHLVI